MPVIPSTSCSPCSFSVLWTPFWTQTVKCCSLERHQHNFPDLYWVQIWSGSFCYSLSWLQRFCCGCKQLKLALNPEVILPCSPQPLKFQPRSVKGVNLLFFCFFLGCTILLSPPSLFLYSLTRWPRQCHILSFLLLKCLTAVMVGDCSRQDKPRVLWEDNYSLCYVSD